MFCVPGGVRVRSEADVHALRPLCLRGETHPILTAPCLRCPSRGLLRKLAACRDWCLIWLCLFHAPLRVDLASSWPLYLIAVNSEIWYACTHPQDCIVRWVMYERSKNQHRMGNHLNAQEATCVMPLLSASPRYLCERTCRMRRCVPCRSAAETWWTAGARCAENRSQCQI